MKSKLSKLNIITIVLISISLLIVLFFIAYGLFEYGIDITGNKDNQISTCSIDMNLLEDNPVNLLNSYPIEDTDIDKYEPLVLTLTNSSECEEVYYSFSFIDYCNTCIKTNNMCLVGDKNINCSDPYKIDSNLIKYEIINVETNDRVLGTNPSSANISGKFTINGETDTYEIKLWIINTATNNDLYVYDNNVPLENNDGHYATKNYLSKIKLEISNTQ